MVLQVRSFTNIPLYTQRTACSFLLKPLINFESDVENTLLYTDAIQFDNGENQQEVQLVTLVQDANLSLSKNKYRWNERNNYH